MLTSVRNPNPTVTRMADTFFSAHSLSQSLHMAKSLRDTCGSKVELRDKVKWIKVKRYGWYQYKHSLTKDEPWKDVCLLRNGTEAISTAPSVQLLPRQNLAVRKAKVVDIKKQLKYVPQVYQWLYLNLKADNGDDGDLMSHVPEDITQVLKITVHTNSVAYSVLCYLH